MFGDDVDVVLERDFQLLLIAGGFASIGSALLSPMLDTLIDPLGATPSNIGLLISAFTGPGIVIIPIAGVLADRYGRKPVLITGLVVFGITGALIGFTNEFWIAVGLRVLQGAGFAGMMPIVITSIGDLYTGEKEATAQGFRFTVGGIFQTVFPVISGVLVVIAWHYPFFIYALTIPVAGFVYLWFDEPIKHDHHSGAVTDGGENRSQFAELRELIGHRRVQSLIAARGMTPVVWIAFLTYNSIIVVQLMGGSPAQAGILTAIGSLTYASVATQAGQITAFFDSRLYPLVAAHVCMGLGFVIIVLSPVVIVATVGVVLAGIGFGITGSLYRSIITGLAPPRVRGGLVSLSESIGRLTATATPICMGLGIAVTTPLIGFTPAVQLTGIVTAIAATIIGVASLSIATSSSPITLRS